MTASNLSDCVESLADRLAELPQLERLCLLQQLMLNLMDRTEQTDEEGLYVELETRLVQAKQKLER